MQNFCHYPRTNPYVPQFDATFEAYTKKFLMKNFWRVSSEYALEDLSQEAWHVFLENKRRYQGVVDNAAWFMSLYKRALFNRITDFAYKSSKHHAHLMYEDPELEESFASVFDVLPDSSTLSPEAVTMLEKAPPEIRKALQLLLSENKKWCESALIKAVGLSAGHPLFDRLKQYVAA